MLADSLITRCASAVVALTLKIVVVALLLMSSALAHEIRPAVVDLNYTNTVGVTAGAELTIEILLNLESIMAGIGPEHDDTDDSENSALYKTLRAMSSQQLAAEFEGFKSRFVSSVEIKDAEELNIPKQFESLSIPPVGDINIPRDSKIKLNVPLSDGSSSISWQWQKNFGEVIVRANSDVQTMDYAVLLSPGQATPLLDFTVKTEQSKSDIAINYIVVGFEHILPKGLDHILFVIGLFLLAPRWRPLAVQVTTFTIAHSITLALGSAGLLSVSPSIVEPLIALSIVLVCVENVATSRLNKWRITMVFVFGLLHGLGFASVLDEVGLAPNYFFVALLGFNVGVELGQLLIVAACMLLAGMWFGDKAWYRPYFSKPVSIGVGLVGLYWFLQRTVLV